MLLLLDTVPSMTMHSIQSASLQLHIQSMLTDQANVQVRSFSGGGHSYRPAGSLRGAERRPWQALLLLLLLCSGAPPGCCVAPARGTAEAVCGWHTAGAGAARGTRAPEAGCQVGHGYC